VKLISVNVGGPHPIPGEDDSTGIVKEPASAPVFVGELGLEGDTIIHTDVHGGPHQAVYLYPQADLDFWSAMLDRTIAPGTFGENLTIDGLESDDLCFGDRLKFAEVELEITAPREPCKTFGRIMGDDAFPGRFRIEGRMGAYARVISKGHVAAGESFVHIPFDGPRIPVAILLRPVDPALLPALLQTPLHPKARARLTR